MQFCHYYLSSDYHSPPFLAARYHLDCFGASAPRLTRCISVKL